MNLPNKLTLSRIFLIPFFVGMYIFQDKIPSSDYVLIFIFVLASITDFLDGYIARKHNIVTDFGKFMDPLADKLLVCSALILCTAAGKLDPIIVIVIVARDFIISGVRLIAASKGTVIAASYWGKFKTFFQMIMIVMLLFNTTNTIFLFMTKIVVLIAFLLTIISLIDYMWKNKKFISSCK